MVGRTIIFAMLIGLVIKRNQTSFPRDVIELKSELTTTKKWHFSKYFVEQPKSETLSCTPDTFITHLNKGLFTSFISAVCLQFFVSF